jgi:hypothetical protein
MQRERLIKKFREKPEDDSSSVKGEEEDKDL